MHRRPLLSLLLLTAALGSAGCEHRRPDNVVLVVVDTLRSDHLGCYGYPLATSPNLDGLAETGHVFDAAIAQSSWTSPSIASLFTSLYPSAHGVTGFASALPEPLMTLAEVLNQRGMSTAGFSANMAFINPARGFDQGFETFEVMDRKGRPDEKDQMLFRRVPGEANLVTDRALRFLEERGDDPFFLYLHYIDPHSPYAAPAPFRDRFVADRATGDKASADSDKDLFGYGGKVLGNQANVRRLIALYDAEIAFTDEQIGRVLDHLETTGRLGDTIVVITSDHGEEFHEHGGFDHGTTLYREQVQVPLIVRLPDDPGSGRRVAQTVGLVDIGPTVLDLLGLQDPRSSVGSSFASSLHRRDLASIAGRSFASVARRILDAVGLADQPAKHDQGYSELGKVTRKAADPRHSRALQSSDWHYLVDSGGQEELFHLALDPAEQENLAGPRAEITRKMAAQVQGLLGRSTRFEQTTEPRESLGDEERERLRALGYAE